MELLYQPPGLRCDVDSQTILTVGAPGAAPRTLRFTGMTYAASPVFITHVRITTVPG